MDFGDLLGLLILLGIPTTLVVLFIKLRRTSKERDALLRDKKALTELKDTLIKQNAELEAENALVLSENLKIQLEPHTLKNIMAKLQGFASGLNTGINAMVGTMNYVLYKSGTHKVSVEEEIGYIDDYVTMHQILRNESAGMDVVTDDVDKNSRWYQTSCIPHLITGYLVENAFKHGDLNQPDFLRIKVSLNDRQFRLEVINRVRSTRSLEPGGVGMKNMKERLELLVGDAHHLEHGPISGQFYRALLTINFPA